MQHVSSREGLPHGSIRGASVFLNFLDGWTANLQAQLEVLRGSLGLHPCAPVAFEEVANSKVNTLAQAISEFSSELREAATSAAPSNAWPLAGASPSRGSRGGPGYASPLGGQSPPMSPGLAPSPSGFEFRRSRRPSCSASIVSGQSGSIRMAEARSVDSSPGPLTPGSSEAAPHTWASDAQLAINREAMRIHEAWKPNDSQVSARFVPTSSFIHELESSNRGTPQPEEDPGRVSRFIRQNLITDPASHRRCLWNILCLGAVCYDVLMVPLMAFDFEERVPEAARVSMATTVFWTVDMVGSFFLAYYDTTGLVTKPGKVAWRYFTTWFATDVVIVSVDYAPHIVDDTAAEGVSVAKLGRAIRFVRILRALRMLRMMRLIKLSTLLDALDDWVYTGTLRAAFKIFKLLLVIAIITHFIACGWYAVGTFGQLDLSQTWLAKLEASDASYVHRYLVSFHWAISQFTPAAVDYHPANERERLYAILVLFAGLVIFSSFLGSVSSTLTLAREQMVQKTRQESLFRKFVLQNNVSAEVGNRVAQFLKNTRKACNRVHEKELTDMALLPETLLMKLRHEVHAPVITKHMLFFVLDQSHPSLTREICHYVAQQQLFSKGDEIFRIGSAAREMLFIVSGCLDYGSLGTQGKETSFHHAGSWMAEASLWMRWQHFGTLVVETACDVTGLDGDRLRAVAMRHADSLAKLRKYAYAFTHKASRTLPLPNLDTFGSPHTVQQLVDVCFPLEARRSTSGYSMFALPRITSFRSAASPSASRVLGSQGSPRTSSSPRSCSHHLPVALGHTVGHTVSAVAANDLQPPAQKGDEQRANGKMILAV